MRNLTLIGKAVLEKKRFENNGNIHVFSPRADNPLGYLFFINTIIQSFAASFPPKKLCNSFPHSNIYATQFDLAVK